MLIARAARFQVAGLAVTCLTIVSLGSAPADNKPLVFQARHRVEDTKDASRFHVVTDAVSWDPAHTALVICDMWDRHWCKSATRRVAEMAPRINDFANALRARGVLIIHCPSETMDYYKNTPGRKLAQAAPKVPTAVPLQGWCALAGGREPPLPIDDSDGGCPDDPPCKQYRAWSHEIDSIEIRDGDAITDSAEAFYLMKQRGITNVLVVGVHENMCVLGRPFSIRQMVTQGQNVLLVRDLTDTMYNPKMSPRVDHFTGTDLVAEHIEKYWCPSIASNQVLGGEPFRFAEDPRQAGGARESPAASRQAGSPR